MTAVAAIFLPGNGLYRKLRTYRATTTRVLLEDALKHLYDFEYLRRVPTVDSLAGCLGVSRGRATELAVRAAELGLVRSEDGRFRLTPEGRDGALRVIRVHRLWEQYLAQETGLQEADWHRQAEYHEHHLTEEEVERLAQRMGHPAFDPHGDPIPTASGDLTPPPGKPLTSSAAGEVVTVVHIEDEPETVYAQLRAEGLYLGQRLGVIEASPERIRFWANENEHHLAPILAASVTVLPVPEEAAEEASGPALTSLAPGEHGRVVRILQSCRGLERRRLLDLGVLPGTDVEALMRSPSGQPTAYRVRGAAIALRRTLTDQILIARTSPDSSGDSLGPND